MGLTLWAAQASKELHSFTDSFTEANVPGTAQGAFLFAQSCPTLCDTHQDLNSLAPHERLPELPVVPPEKPTQALQLGKTTAKS